MLRLYRTFRIVPWVTAEFHPLHRVAAVCRALAEARWVHHDAFSCTVAWWDLFWTSMVTNQLHQFHYAVRQERNLTDVLGEGLRPRKRSATFLSDSCSPIRNLHVRSRKHGKMLGNAYVRRGRHATRQQLSRKAWIKILGDKISSTEGCYICCS